MMLAGTLRIRWEYLSAGGVPFNGMGIYIEDGQLPQDVWFSTKNYGVSTEKIVYSIYTLPEASRVVVENEHLRFVEEIGHVKDYGPDIFNMTVNGGMFKYNLDENSLAGILVGLLAYGQIQNKYPHV